MDHESGPSPIPAAVREFVEERFDSVAQIEVFLHLFRRGGAWTADGVSASIGLGTSHARVALDALVDARLLQRADGRYSAVRDVSPSATALEAVYARFRLRIIEIVTSGSARREGGGGW